MRNKTNQIKMFQHECLVFSASLLVVLFLISYFDLVSPLLA